MKELKLCAAIVTTTKYNGKKAARMDNGILYLINDNENPVEIGDVRIFRYFPQDQFCFPVPNEQVMFNNKG